MINKSLQKSTRNKNKLKLNSKEKNYEIHDSPLYKLNSKRKLCDLLHLTKDELKTAIQDKDNYMVYDAKGKNGKSRSIQHPDKNKKHYQTHNRIACLLTRLKLPNYIHSGRKRHSYITNAKQHLGDKKVLTTDIRSFYQSTNINKVFSFFFDAMKCAPDVARILSHICTYNNHIPTGSQVSMLLAFWSNFRMFDELEKLCTKHHVIMTVYVDDITFSGDAVNQLFFSTIRKIISSNGHEAHPEKTKMYKKKDTKLITGIAVKENEIALPHKQCKKIRLGINDCKKNPTPSSKKKLIGLLHASATIDRNIKKLIKNESNKYII